MRSHQFEWMDLGPPYYTPEEYRECLFELDHIGRFLGGDKATVYAFNQLAAPPLSILDVGCGGGTFTLRLASRYPDAQVTGIDISNEAIAFALERLQESITPLSNVQFLVPPSPFLEQFPEKYDVVTATLVCHHLTDDELISFIKEAKRKAKQAVILNDLHRHPLAMIGFAFISRLFYKNAMIRHDGLLSIRRSFKKKDWKRLLKEAEIERKDYEISWHWPFRWIVRIYCE